MRIHIRLALALATTLLAAASVAAASPAAALAAPVWNVQAGADPTSFQTADDLGFGVTIDASGGTYTLTFEGQTTSPLPANATTGEIQSALDALGSIGGVGADVTVAYSADAGVVRAYSVKLGGTLASASLATGSVTIDATALTGEEHTPITVALDDNDAYWLQVENLGTSASSGTVTVEDRLPAGVATAATPYAWGAGTSGWTCSTGSGQTVVTCTETAAVAAATSTYDDEGSEESAADPPSIVIPVSVAAATSGVLTDTVSVSGGGAAYPATVSIPTEANVPETDSFGLANLSFHVIGEDGEPFTQAGGHPWAVSTDFEDDKEIKPAVTNAAENLGGVSTGGGGTTGGFEAGTRVAPGGDEQRTVVADLPLGLIGDPQATPQCPPALVVGDNVTNCPPDTEVGVMWVGRGPATGGPYQVYNLVPQGHHAAQFGISYSVFKIYLYGDVVRTPHGYVLRIEANVPRSGVGSLSLTFFGDPAAAFAAELSPGEAQAARHVPFLTNPVDCLAGEAARTLDLNSDSWASPGALNAEGLPELADSNWAPAEATLPSLQGCEALRFGASLGLAPSEASEGGTTQADKPSGYDVNLRVPQTESYDELATPELKTATVTLPQGVSVSPSAANGLEACTNAEIALESSGPGSCPLGSQIGTVRITTPLLPAPLEGEVFLGEPECSPCTEADASEGRIFRLFLQVHSEKLGVTIKLPGSVRANPATGQLTATFAENPQLPFSDLELRFKDGERAPLANPQTCGTFTTSSTLTAWSEPATAPVVWPSSFEITGCGSSLAFNPGFTAGMASPAAGAASSFSVSFSRSDGEQDLGGIIVSTPPGLLGRIAGIPQCAEAQANAGSCPAASEIGTTTVSAGPGASPYTIGGGRVYLTGPYKNQPFGLSIVVAAVAGPFDLGDVVIRASIAVNPVTAALTITSDALPQIVDGVPIRLRTVNVEIDRPGFMYNATDCAVQSIAATISGEHPIASSEADQDSAKAAPYAASGCAGLPFAPAFTAATEGKVSSTLKGEGASLDVKIATPAGQANIKRVDVTLPKQLPARLQPTLQNACTESQFAANPAGCPEDSVVGTATAVTPVLNVPLTGSAVFVSHGGLQFPDLDLVLKGEGVTIVLTGHTQIKDGITYSKFETVPDAPISSFELDLPEGPHSALDSGLSTAVHSLCGQKLQMPTVIEGQNGAVVEQDTRISITGCPAKAAAKKPTMTIKKVQLKARKNLLLVTVKTSQQGRVRISGPGLKTTTKTKVKPGSHQITIKLTKTGRNDKTTHKKTKLRASLTIGKNATAKTKTVKL